ncbi:MAG: hypothetical protein GY817_04575 [bacterium]|nr:hypothetical protein [bacterium]
MQINGDSVNIIANLEEARIVSQKYDIAILDIKDQKEDVGMSIKTLKNSSRDLVVDLISSNLKHRDIAKEQGARFFLSPMEKHYLEEWAEHLKNI